MKRIIPPGMAAMAGMAQLCKSAGQMGKMVRTFSRLAAEAEQRQIEEYRRDAMAKSAGYESWAAMMYEAESVSLLAAVKRLERKVPGEK